MAYIRKIIINFMLTIGYSYGKMVAVRKQILRAKLKRVIQMLSVVWKVLKDTRFALAVGRAED